MGDAVKELPSGIHYQSLMVYIGQKYNMPGVYHLDLWPIGNPMIIISDPAAITQMTQVNSLPKHPVNDTFVGSLVGRPSIVVVEGAEWKMIRNIIMPSFAPSYMASLTPVIRKHVERFLHILDNHATTGESFKLQDACMSLTFDVIAEVVMGVDSESQRGYNALSYHFGRAAKNTPISGLSLDFIRMYVPRWWHASRQTKIVRKIILQRHADRSTISKSKKPKAAIDLFIQAYQEQQQPEKPTSSDKDVLDPAFLNLAIVNIKSLLLGGHDTTSTAIAYTLALLSTHPKVLAKLHAEAEQLFNTTSFTSIADQIDAKPSLLSDSNLPYTTACIKESLRMFTPASTTRINRSSTRINYTSTSADGTPTQHHIPTLPLAHLWLLHTRLHKDPNLFPEPHSFIPERFHPSSPFPPIPRDAWRPFEKGPRACIGMELAMNEIKMTLLAVAMSGLEVVVDYAEDAPRAPLGSGLGGPDGRWWQVIEFAAKPVGGMPVRLRRREEKKK